jgi:hypothetical protein
MTDLSDSFFIAIDEFDKLPPKEKARKMQEAGKKIFGQPPKKKE